MSQETLNKVILTLGRVSVTDSPRRVEGVHSNPPHPLCVLALGERLQLGDRNWLLLFRITVSHLFLVTAFSEQCVIHSTQCYFKF